MWFNIINCYGYNCNPLNLFWYEVFSYYYWQNEVIDGQEK